MILRFKYHKLQLQVSPVTAAQQGVPRVQKGRRQSAAGSSMNSKVNGVERDLGVFASIDIPLPCTLYEMLSI